MKCSPRPKMGEGASDSDNDDDDDSDGSLDILHHPGPGESLVSGLERERGSAGSGMQHQRTGINLEPV